MPSKSLDDLPLELLQHVTTYIGHKCLLSFGFVNRACRAAAIPGIFESLSFRLARQEPLDNDVATFTKVLREANAFKHVRSLEIVGDFRNSRHGRAWSTGHVVEDTRGRWHPTPISTDGKSAACTYEDNAIWEPLAVLMSELRALQDLVFATPHQFPPCLLKVLHSSLPSCKLHMRFFRLRSLLDENIDPHEYQLATSPNLATVQTRYGIIDPDGNYDFNDLAVCEMVSGLAPALQQAHLSWCESVSGSGFEPSDPRGHWKGITCDNPLGRGNLKSLGIGTDTDGSDLISPVGLARWASLTDLSKLQRLYMGLVSPDAMEWLAEQDLQSLQALRLTAFDVEIHLADGISVLLKSLPPLQELDLHGYFDYNNLVSLCHQQRGTASLRRLGIRSEAVVSSEVPDHECIQLLLDHCPNLEDLRIGIQRTLGDGDEITAYQLLGCFPKLHTLKLALECTIPHKYELVDETSTYRTMPIEPWFQAFEAEIFMPARGYGPSHPRVRNGHMMKTFVNSAIDKSLAIAIWDLISGAKTFGSVPLRSLRLRPHVSMPGLVAYPSDTLGALRVSWDLAASIRDDESRPIVKATDKWMHARRRHEMKPMDPHYAAILERLWPGISEQGTKWKAYWRSRPFCSSHSPISRMTWR